MHLGRNRRWVALIAGILYVFKIVQVSCNCRIIPLNKYDRSTDECKLIAFYSFYPFVSIY